MKIKKKKVTLCRGRVQCFDTNLATKVPQAPGLPCQNSTYPILELTKAQRMVPALCSWCIKPRFRCRHTYNKYDILSFKTLEVSLVTSLSERDT